MTTNHRLIPLFAYRMCVLALALGLLACSGVARPGETLRVHDASEGFLNGSRQILVVRTPDWDSVTGTMQRFQRTHGKAPWQAAGEPFPVNLGRAGQGWGRGLHPNGTALPGEPEKQEGDGRAPTGIFALTAGFAYDPSELAGAALHIVPVDHDLVCVDDPASRSYNALTSRSMPDKDWNSFEDMLRQDGLYRYGIIVAHNQNPARPGAGSCIFLHVEKAPGAGTAGCTSMAPEMIRSVILWLDPVAKPLLAQFPEPLYARVRQPWHLP